MELDEVNCFMLGVDPNSIATILLLLNSVSIPPKLYIKTASSQLARQLLRLFLQFPDCFSFNVVS